MEMKSSFGGVEGIFGNYSGPWDCGTLGWLSGDSVGGCWTQLGMIVYYREWLQQYISHAVSIPATYRSLQSPAINS